MRNFQIVRCFLSKFIHGCQPNMHRKTVVHSVCIIAFIHTACSLIERSTSSWCDASVFVLSLRHVFRIFWCECILFSCKQISFTHTHKHLYRSRLCVFHRCDITGTYLSISFIHLVVQFISLRLWKLLFIPKKKCQNFVSWNDFWCIFQ